MVTWVMGDCKSGWPSRALTGIGLDSLNTAIDSKESNLAVYM